MDNRGPFRVQRPESKKELTHPVEQPLEKRAVQDMPRAGYARQQYAEQAPKKSGKRFVMPLIIAVLLIALGALGWFAWSGMKNTSLAIDGDKYQAVFFTNGQAYFGKLATLNDEYLKMTDIFYLQTDSTKSDASQNPQATSGDQSSSSVQLIKLGDEIHGPEDEMVISKEQVLFYENLKSNSKVASSIKQYKDTH